MRMAKALLLFVVAPVILHVDGCQDKDRVECQKRKSFCTSTAPLKDGTGTAQSFTEEHCPDTCGVCCHDQFDDCQKYESNCNNTRQLPASLGEGTFQSLMKARCPVTCGYQRCKPVDCKWGEWSDWGQCSKTCGGGNQERTRSFDQQAEYGGASCPGKATETRGCNAQACTLCPNDNESVGCSGLKKFRNYRLAAPYDTYMADNCPATCGHCEKPECNGRFDSRYFNNDNRQIDSEICKNWVQENPCKDRNWNGGHVTFAEIKESSKCAWSCCFYQGVMI